MGLLSGVLDTRASWIGKHEVVEVSYDPARVEYGQLLATAIEQGCATRVWATDARTLEIAREQLGDRAERLVETPRVAKEPDQLYYLRQLPLRYVPLTPLQARRVNGRLGTQSIVGPEFHMSARQRETAKRIERALEKDPSALDGLERPDERSKIGAYARELQSRIQPFD